MADPKAGVNSTDDLPVNNPENVEPKPKPEPKSE